MKHIAVYLNFRTVYKLNDVPPPENPLGNLPVPSPDRGGGLDVGIPCLKKTKTTETVTETTAASVYRCGPCSTGGVKEKEDEKYAEVHCPTKKARTLSF